MIRELVDGAAYLFSNEYESHLIESKTGWSADEIVSRVGVQVITLGPAGVRIVGTDLDTVEVSAVPDVVAVEPTGVGDAFRSGFLAALSWQLPHERAAQVGCVLAAYVVEQVGTQEYSFTHAQFLERLEKAYGDESAAAVAPHLAAGDGVS